MIQLRQAEKLSLVGSMQQFADSLWRPWVQRRRDMPVEREIENLQARIFQPDRTQRRIERRRIAKLVAFGVAPTLHMPKISGPSWS